MMKVGREKDEEIEKESSCRWYTIRYNKPTKSNGLLFYE